LTQRAGLRPDQRDAIAKAWLEEGQKVGTLMAEARAEDGNFRDVREKVDELRSKTDEALASTLDDDQLNEYEAVRAEMNRRGRGDRGGQPSQ
jgi:predicted  nucleic acid-binding Zn-ribbon protein